MEGVDLEHGGRDSGFLCSSGETTQPDTKVPPVGEAPHSVVSEDRVLAPPTAGRWRVPVGRQPLTLSVCCSSPATMAVRHLGAGRPTSRPRDCYGTMSLSSARPEPSIGSRKAARSLPNHGDTNQPAVGSQPGKGSLEPLPM